MKKDLICPVYIVLIVTAYLTAESQGTNPSVTLMVEGRESLVGEHCPGTVKISCNGVDLSILRWRFNGSTDVITFFSDNVAPSPFTNNPAFINAELLSVAPDPLDPNFANFSSELVVDVSNLRTESVISITCGDPDTFEMIPVDVEIVREAEPESPNVINVTALYQDGSLRDVTVSWEKLEPRCAEFQTSLVYQVTLLGSSVVAVNHTSCGQVCITRFQNFSNAFEEYRVSLYAVNAIGTSEVVEYPTSIMKRSGSYFTPTFLSSDCLFTCECFSNASLNTNSCDVLYTTDSMYLGSSMIVSPLNTQFEIAGITSDIIYYFEFSISVNGTLLVRNRLTEKTVSSPRVSAVAIVFLALTIFFIIVGAVVICITKQLLAVKANIVLLVACLLGMLSLIFLTVFSIITGVQQDTCSLVWSRARDALIIAAFLFAIVGNFILVGILLVSSQHKKSGKINQYSNEPPGSQINMNCDTSSGRVDAPADLENNSEETEASPETTNTTLEAEVQNTDGEPEASQNKKGGLFTVYQVVVRLQDRSYFLFRRYNEFKTLFDKIKEKYPSKLKFPGKKLLRNNLDPNFITKRRIELHDFIINVMKIPNIVDFPPVREFLAMDETRSARSALPINDEPADERKVKEADRLELGEKEDTTAKITDFDLLEVIGKETFRKGTFGKVTFGKVYLGRHKGTGAFYAIKVLLNKAIVERRGVKHIMAKINNTTHPFLVGLHYSFQTSTKLYFVLDYVNGGKLSFHLERETFFDEPRARFYAAEITSALAYLHTFNIIYWDLKLENILLDASGHTVLTDFGLCKEEGNKSHNTTMVCGTPEYLAPEVLRNEEYDCSVDWWCLGVVTYEMMCGRPPFYSSDAAKIQSNILNQVLQLPSHITINAQDLLEGLLGKDKISRLGSEIGDERIKAHPFFGPINWNALLHKRLKPPFNPQVKDYLKIRHFGSEFTTEAISVSIAENTVDVMN